MPTAITDQPSGTRHFAMPQPINDRLATTSEAAPVSSGPSKPMEEAQKFTDAQHKPLANSGQNDKVQQGITFAAQDRLAKLPIPELESSIKKYLAALKPLQSVREHAETQQAAEEFLKGGQGAELQEKLKKYATGKTSYIEQFCKLAPPLSSIQFLKSKANKDSIQGTTPTLTTTTPSS